MVDKAQIKDKMDSLLKKMKELEDEIVEELQKKEKKFLYEIKEKKVRFEQEVLEQHRRLAKRLPGYLRDASPWSILTAPMLYSIFIPSILLDFFASVYQAVCFPVYGIPKVKRGDYIVIDRHFLQYLNIIEKINCVYCGYFNGLVAYLREIAARTEQYWCPIKHARKTGAIHSRYDKFVEYGDAEAYHQRLMEIRKAYDDITNS